LLSNPDYFNTQFPDWISPVTNEFDLRGFYLIANPGNGYNATPCAGDYCQTFNWPADDTILGTVSTITNLPVQYTTEAIFYAQSAYFVTIVMVQWSNVFACKSRKVLHFLFRFPSPTVV